MAGPGPGRPGRSARTQIRLPSIVLPGAALLRTAIDGRLIRRRALILACCSLLMLVVLVPGDTTANGTKNPVMRHMAGNATGKSPTDTANRMCAWSPAEAAAHDGETNNQNTDLHLLHPQ